jgi:hypothetical protein
MKTSIFKKSITVTGVNGRIFEAWVVANLNYRSAVSTGTNAITHDDYAKQIFFHKVEAWIKGTPDSLIVRYDNLTTEEEVLTYSKKAIDEAEKHLNKIATMPSEPTFLEKMQALFS